MSTLLHCTIHVHVHVQCMYCIVHFVVSLFYSVRLSASNEEAGFGATDAVNATTGTNYNVFVLNIIK